MTKHSKVRRAKLYYLRELRGKAARLKEVRIQSKKGTGQAKKKAKAAAKSAAKRAAAGSGEKAEAKPQAKPEE